MSSLKDKPVTTNKWRGETKTQSNSTEWFSDEDRPRVLYRLPKDIFFSPMKRVTVEDVEENTARALQFISTVAGEGSTAPLGLSAAAFRDHDVVRTLLEIEHTVSLVRKRLDEAFDSLTDDIREMGKSLARDVLEALHEDFQSDSGGETRPKLRCVAQDFQLWLEHLTDAAARISLGVRKDVV